jgi:hypothetical protein
MLYRYARAVATVLTNDALTASVLPDISSFQEELDTSDLDFTPDVQGDLVERLFAHSLEMYLDRLQTDAWLAPRLHYALRVPRRVAGDSGFWTWVATRYGRDYLAHRWEGAKNLEWRYTGTLTRNGISRLWWAAELTRNGPDYSVVPFSVRNATTAQFALELKYSWYRPAVIAFVRVAEGVDGQPALNSVQTKTLSTRINALTVLRPVEAIGFDPRAGEEDYDADWFRHRPAFEEVAATDLPRGPNSGLASPEAIAALTEWFRQLAALRGSGTSADPEAAA